MIIAIQTARANSKSIPRKNELEVGAVPLFCKVLQFAMDAKHISHVFCSTDIETKSYARFLEGVHLIERPPELATDFCSHYDTMFHALKVAEAQLGAVADIVIFFTRKLCFRFSR